MGTCAYQARTGSRGSSAAQRGENARGTVAWRHPRLAQAGRRFQGADESVTNPIQYPEVRIAGDMRWYVQLSAILDAIFAESVIDAVALDLEREGVLYGSEAVQGNPGPSLDACMVVEAPTSREAIATASALVSEALRRAGVESSTYSFDSHVMPISEVERLMKATQDDIDYPAGGNWLALRVVDDEDASPRA